MNYGSQKRKSEWDRTLFRSLVLMTTGGIVLAMLLALIGVWRTGSRFFHELEVMWNFLMGLARKC